MTETTTTPTIPLNPRKPAEIAARYGVHEKTVRNWVKRGCPHRRLGHLLRFVDEEVDAWSAKSGRPVPTETVEVTNAAHE